MQSASQYEAKIEEFLSLECTAGRVLVPFNYNTVPHVHINRLGAVPKNTPGKYCPIVDLSHPNGHSVNNGVPETMCQLR